MNLEMRRRNTTMGYQNRNQNKNKLKKIKSVKRVRQDLVELKPLGMNMSGLTSKPVLLLKDVSGEITMPLPITNLDAGILMQQTGQGAVMASPHGITEEILKLVSLKIKRCVFTEYHQNHLYCVLEFFNKKESLKVKAEQAISLCLYLNVSLYATRDLIWKARQQSMEKSYQEELLLLQAGFSRHHQYLQ
jgi:uncharacterized protein